MKRVETTKWWSHDYALNTVIDTYDALCETLGVLQTENNSSDRKRLHQAASLKDCLTSDWFLLTAFLYKTIFNIITPLSKLLQTKDIDMIDVVTEVQKKNSELKNSRSNFKFQNIVNEVKNFKKSSTMFYENSKPLAQKRTKRIPQLPGELASDEIIENPLDSFKINTFFVAYDTSITQIKSRFTEQTSDIFKDISLFSRLLKKYQKTYKHFLKMHFLCLQMFIKNILMLKILGESTYNSVNVILVLKKLSINQQNYITVITMKFMKTLHHLLTLVIKI